MTCQTLIVNNSVAEESKGGPSRNQPGPAHLQLLSYPNFDDVRKDTCRAQAVLFGSGSKPLPSYIHSYIRTDYM